MPRRATGAVYQNEEPDVRERLLLQGQLGQQDVDVEARACVPRNSACLEILAG